MLTYFSSLSPFLFFYISFSIIVVLEKISLEIWRPHCDEFDGCGFIDYVVMLLVDTYV
jgi:hypothetical protein